MMEMATTADASVEERFDEGALLRAIHAGDRAAAEELVAQTYELVYASLYRMCGDRDLASDLTQDTYQKAWESIATFEGRSRLSTWLYRIAYTTFLNHIRRPRRIVPLEEPAAAVLKDPGQDALDALQESEEAEHLRKAVLELPENLRYAVTAHFWGGIAVSDLARSERVTTVAIRKRLHKAFVLMQKTLGVDSR